MAIVRSLFIRWGITKFTFRAYIVQYNGDLNLVSRHYKFILAKNITILSVSSDDFLHAFLKIAEQQMWNYSSYSKNKIV